MMRQFLTVFLPLIAPTLLYLLWLRYFNRKGRTAQRQHWFWAVGVGAVLAILSLLATGAYRSHDPHSGYAPPRFENGVLIPAKVLPPKPDNGAANGE